MYRFIDPLKGGRDGAGWPWAVDLSGRDVSDVIAAVDGVELVTDVALFDVDLRGGPNQAGERIGSALDVVPLGADSLFLSFQHQVVIEHERG